MKLACASRLPGRRRCSLCGVTLSTPRRRSLWRRRTTAMPAAMGAASPRLPGLGPVLVLVQARVLVRVRAAQ